MKKMLPLGLLCLLVGPAATAQVARPGRKAAPGRAEVSAGADAQIDRILERYVEALGGRAAVTGVRSRVMRGHVEMPALNASGSIEAYYKAPNKSLTVINMPGRTQLLEAYDGRNGWMQLPYVGVFDLNQKTTDALRRDLDGGYDIRLRESFGRVKFLGRERVKERETYVIEATPRAGSPERMYFDVETGLLLRLDLTRDTVTARGVKGTITFDGFAVVDGVRMPTVIRQDFGDFSLTFRIYEIKHNVRIEDALFDRPEGTKADPPEEIQP